MKFLNQFSEECKFNFFLSRILVQVKPAPIRIPKAECDYFTPEAPPALGTPVDSGDLLASLVLRLSGLLPVCLVQLHA